jgi:hypothetical protein
LGAEHLPALRSDIENDEGVEFEIHCVNAIAYRKNSQKTSMAILCGDKTLKNQNEIG